MTELTFKSKNILNSHLYHGQSTSPAYTTASSETALLLRRKLTTLTGAGVGGAIHWREEWFQVGGTQKSIERIRSGWALFTSTRKWTWNGHTYTVEHSGSEWTAAMDTSQRRTVAHFRPRTFRILKFEWEAASVSVSPDIQDEEQRVFLILVMLFSETMYQDRKRRRRTGGAGAVGGAVGGAGAC